MEFRRGPLAIVLAAAIWGMPAAAEPRPTRPKRQISQSDSADGLAPIQLSLLNLASNARDQRILLGGLFLGTGLLFSGAYIAHQQLHTGVSRRLGEGVLGVVVGISTIGGLTALLFRSEFETAPQEFVRLNARSPNEATALQGEALLSRLAHRAKFTRRLVGGAFAAMGVADVTLHLAEGGSGSTAFLAYKGAFFLTLGVAFALFKWPAELEWESYQQKSQPPLTLQVLPTATGLGIALRF